MKLENNDEQLINKLRQLPKIEDHGNKDELFQRISRHSVNKKQHRNYRLAPILSTLIVAVLIITVIPTLTNLGLPRNSLNDSATNLAKESAENYNAEMYSTDQDTNEAETSLDDWAIDSYVLQDVSDLTVIYSAVTDNQLQTVIPVTIISEETDNNLNTLYNQLGEYLETNDWGVKDYLFKHVNFDIDLDKHEVLMNFSDEFSLGEGSANPAIFVNMLTKMFGPYQIEKIVFNKEVDLGPIGKVSELPLESQEKENYKMFQADEHWREFLVPIKMDDSVTIEEAIQDMEKGQPSFNIYPTIPEDVQFSFKSTSEELIITLENDQALENMQKTVVMIESILMTAKSFGYEKVTFNGMPVDQIGPYQLSESVTVPEAINPIYQ